MQTVPTEQQLLRVGVFHLHLHCWVRSKRNRQCTFVSTVSGRLYFHERGSPLHDLSRRILFSGRRQRVLYYLRGRIRICSERILQLRSLSFGPHLSCGRSDGLPDGACGILLLIRGQHRLSDVRPRNIQRSCRAGSVPAMFLGHGDG